MNNKNRYLLLFFLIPAMTHAASQSDWSNGSTTDIANDWEAEFSSSSNINWRGKAGQISLSTTITNTIQQNIIAGDAQRPYGIAVGDLSGNGYDEVLTTHPTITAGVYPFDDPRSQGAIYMWRLNEQNNWIRQIVTEEFYGVHSTEVMDFDGDGDLDVLAVASSGITDPPAPAPTNRNGRFAWFDNVKGDASRWVKHEVGYGFWGAIDVEAADIDGDGDMDIMGISALTTGGLYQQSSDVTWFENSDGKGASWIQHDVDDLLSQRPYDSKITDIDGDGDIDFIVTQWNEILIYENSGDGSQFSKRVMSNLIYGNPAVEIGDMDNDGDMDVIISSPRDSYVHWQENVNGDASQWQDHLIFYLTNVHQQEAVDFDGDGDLDLLISYYLDGDNRFGRSYLFENTSGDGLSWAYYEVKDFLNYHTFSRAGDVNNDGRLDVVVMEQDFNRNNDEQLSWFDLGEFTANGLLDSQILDGGVTPSWNNFTWNATVPSSTVMSVQVRAGNDANNLGGFSTLPGIATDLSTIIDTSARYFQYRVEMASSDVNQSPILTGIGFDLPVETTPPPPVIPPPPAENQVPVADAGNDNTYSPRVTATLDGSASNDADGNIVAYQWVQVSGRSVTLNNADQAIATFTTPGVKRNRTRTLVFELTVTDDDGASNTDTVVITVAR